MRLIAIFAAALAFAGAATAPAATAETRSIHAAVTVQPPFTSPAPEQYRYRHRYYRPGYNYAWRNRYYRPSYRYAWRSRYYRPHYRSYGYRYRGRHWHRGWRG